MYVATRQLKIGDEYRQSGDSIPEAAHWPNLATYLRLGWIKDVVVVEPESPPDKQHRAKQRG